MKHFSKRLAIMNRKRWILSLGMLGLGLMLGLGAGARSDQPAADDKSPSASVQEGVEIMARGPIHEAFAEPAIRAPRASPVIAKEPPKSIEEVPPDQKPVG